MSITLIIRIVTIDGLERLSLLRLELGNIDHCHLIHIDINATLAAQKQREGLFDVVCLQEIFQILAGGTTGSAFRELFFFSIFGRQSKKARFDR